MSYSTLPPALVKVLDASSNTRGTGDQWARLMSDLTSRKMDDSLKNAMNRAVQYKIDLYTRKLQQANEFIVNRQINVLKTWCQYGYGKSWLYYYDYDLQKLKEIRTNYTESEIQYYMTARGEAQRKPNGYAPKDDKEYTLQKYLISMGVIDANGKSNERTEGSLKQVASYVVEKEQCNSFTTDWVSSTEPGTEASQRTLINSDAFVDEVKKTNDLFYQALTEMNRYSSILESAYAMKNMSQEKKLKELKQAVLNFDNGTYGESRNDIKDQIAAIIIGFKTDPTPFFRSHLSISLTGPPGTGKTTIAQAIGAIFTRLGLLIKGTELSTQTRATMVGEFVGQTSNKVRNILISNIESVVFIDEAYSLAQATSGGLKDEDTNDKYDQFGVEAINEIVGFLDKFKGEICIITAGYADEMERFFFDVNPGLKRRFQWKWELGPFYPNELFCVMASKLIAFHIESNPNAINEMISKQGQLLMNSMFFSNGKSKENEDKTEFWENLNRFFQNQGGDMELVAGALSESYYLKPQQSRTPLTLQETMNAIWDYLKQRDGKIKIDGQTYMKIFGSYKDAPTVQLQGKEMTWTFSDGKLFHFDAVLPEVCYVDKTQISFDRGATRWIMKIDKNTGEYKWVIDETYNNKTPEDVIEEDDIDPRENNNNNNTRRVKTVNYNENKPKEKPKSVTQAASEYIRNKPKRETTRTKK